MKEIKNIVFIPALMCNEELFQYQINGLNTDNNINIIVHTIKNIDNIKDAVKYVINNSPDEFYLVGISMGGYIAMDLATSYPEKIKKLCLISTNWHKDNIDRKSQRLEAINNAIKNNKVTINNSYIESMVYNYKNLEIIENLTNMYNSLGVKTFINQQKLILSRESYVEKLKNFSKQVLIVCGKNDTLTTKQLHEEMANNIPNASLIDINNCSHLVPLDAKETLLALIKYMIQI